MKSSPLKWVPSAYFAMGLPFIMLNQVLPLMFKDFGISDARIAFWTSLLVLPYSLKPFWSPLLELYRTKKFFVILTQFLCGIALALIAMTLNLGDFFPYVIAISVVIAFSGATHDIAMDGIYMQQLSTTQQAQYIGWQGAFYNIARVAAMGGMVYLVGVLQGSVGLTYAWLIILGGAGALLSCLGLYHTYALPRGGERRASAGSFGATMRETWAVFGEFFKKPHIWIYIAFILSYRLAEGLVIKIVPLFLKADVGLQGLGLSNEKMGLYYGTIGIIAFVVGALLGGYYISWLKLKRVLFTLVCVFNIPFVVYALLAWFQPENPFLVCGGIVFEYFSFGFGSVGLNLFIMQQVAPGKHQMAHYAFGTALGNLGIVLPGMISGAISDALGYQQFFLWALLASVPVLLLVRRVPFTQPEE